MPRVDCVRSTPIVRTSRVMQLEGMFDVPPEKRSEVRWSVDLPLEAKPWQIGLIVGPSGCGKTTIARELFGPAFIDRFDWPDDKSIVDAFPARMSIKDVTGLLSSVGFSSPPAWLRPFRVLSNGEQFRVTIARALAERPELSVIDEFTSVVDRTVAQIGAAAVAKAIRRRSGTRFVAVACHYDVIDWLQPDWIYEPHADSFAWRSLQQRPPIALEISRVHRKAWNLFAHHHYLSRHVTQTAQCFLGSVAGEPAAFTAVCHFPHATHPGYREHRTVCLPDFQGIGLGNAMSEFVAALFVATGRRYYSTTSHPAMIRHRAKSPHWKMTRAPSLVSGDHRGLMRDDRKGGVAAATNRFTAGFLYQGPPAPVSIARQLLSPATAAGLVR